MLTSRGRTDLGADEVEIFDYAEIKKVRPHPQPVLRGTSNGAHGVKAYLKSAYVTINEDELEQKYAQLPDGGPTRTDEEVPSLA
jgi:hypothetical protein